MYRSLNAVLIVETICLLERRVAERFPGSGLSKVAGELRDVAMQVIKVTAEIERPNIFLRAVCGVVIVVIATALTATMAGVRLAPGEWTWVAAIPVMQSVINELVLLGAGVFFLMTLESRIKRGRALKAMHELRSLAHIIDMHQLTKDPHGMLEGGPATPTSPARVLTPYQLSRYLDYCTEMLSLIGKLAALYVQRFDNPVALAAVDGMEDLTNGLSRKIWQKIAMIEAAARTERLAQRPPGSPADPQA